MVEQIKKRIMAPDRKVTAGAVTGTGFGIIISWGYGEATGRMMPPEVAVAMAGFIGFVFSYFIKNKTGGSK